MQAFHNAVKRELLDRFVPRGGRLLDLACGRGGDVHKWLSRGLSSVTGLDVSAKSLQEARGRYARAVAGAVAGERGGAPTHCEFLVADLCEGPWRGRGGGEKYDAVTCMFALHYFWRDERAARAFMETVADNLAPGGHFVGVVPDALQINDRIRRGPVFDNGVVCIRAAWEGQPACFGSAYTCAVRGTVTEGSEVPEYLVYASVLGALAERAGLVPVTSLGDGDGRCFGATADDGGVFWRLEPRYAGPRGGAHAECTGLYRAFAFRKPPPPATSRT